MPLAVTFSEIKVTPYPLVIFDKIIFATGEYLYLIFVSDIAIPDKFKVKFCEVWSALFI